MTSTTKEPNFLLLLDAWKESQLWWWTSPNQWKKVGMCRLLSWTGLNLLLLNEYAHCFSLNRLGYIKRNIWLCAEGYLSTGRLVYLFLCSMSNFLFRAPKYIHFFFLCISRLIWNDMQSSLVSGVWYRQCYAVHPMFSLFIVFFCFFFTLDSRSSHCLLSIPASSGFVSWIIICLSLMLCPNIVDI